MRSWQLCFRVWGWMVMACLGFCVKCARFTATAATGVSTQRAFFGGRRSRTWIGCSRFWLGGSLRLLWAAWSMVFSVVAGLAGPAVLLSCLIWCCIGFVCCCLLMFQFYVILLVKSIDECWILFEWALRDFKCHNWSIDGFSYETHCISDLFFLTLSNKKTRFCFPGIGTTLKAGVTWVLHIWRNMAWSSKRFRTTNFGHQTIVTDDICDSRCTDKTAWSLWNRF